MVKNNYYLILVLILCLVIFSSVSIAQDQVLDYSVESGPTSFDPAELYGNNSIELAQNLFDGLVDVNEDLEIVPCIAESWEITNEGKTFTFYLREDVYFTNGDNVTAEDFKYSWNRALGPDTDNPHLFMMDLIEGAKEVIDGDRTEAEGIVVLDDYSLEVNLEYPAAHFLSLVTRWPYWVVNKNVIEEYGDNWTKPGNIVGTGAYELTEGVLDSYYVFEANDNYFRGAPSLKKAIAHIVPDATIRMMKYETGELDATSNLSPSDMMRVQNDPQLEKDFGSVPMLSTRWLGFRCSTPPFDDIKIRKAFAYAIDRKELIKVALNGMGEAAYTFLPPGMPGYNPDLKPYYYDVEKAKELLKDAGYPNGENFPEFKIYFDSTDEMQRVWQYVQQELKENLGIEVGLESLPWKSYVSIRNDPDTRPALFRNGMGADYPDPQEFLEFFGVSDSFHNFEEFNDEEFDKLIYKANRTVNYEERMSLFQEAERIYLEQVPMIPLYHTISTFLSKEYVNNFGYTPLYIKPLRLMSME